MRAFSLLALLLLLSPEARAAEESREVILAVPRPREALPKLRGAIDGLGGRRSALAGPRPGEAPAKLGLDLFDPAALERAGVNLESPIWVVIPRQSLAPVVELALARPELADAAIARALETPRADAHPLAAEDDAKKDTRSRSGTPAPTSAGKGAIQGLYVGSAADPRMVVWRSGAKLFIQPEPAPAASPASARASIRFASTRRKPALPTSTLGGSRPPDVLLFAQEHGMTTAGAWIAPERIELRGELRLDFAAGLLLGDLAASPGKSRPLFPLARPAAELTAFLGPSAIANALEVGALPVQHARALAGRFHAVLSAEGTLVCAAELAENASDAAVQGLTATVKARYPDAVVARSTPRLLTAVFGGRDEAAVTRALAEKPADAQEARSQAELRVDPKTAFDALGARAQARRGPAPSISKLAVVRYLAGSVEQRASAIRVELSFGPGVVQARAFLDLAKD